MVKVDQATAHRCYNTNLEIQKIKKEESRDSTSPSSSSKVMMVDLDARQGEGRKPEPDSELAKVQIGKEPG